MTREIDAGSTIGEVYMSSLIRAQLRLALTVLGAVGVLIGGFPLLLALVPEIGTARLFALPLPWVLLGGGVPPVLFAAAWWFVRRAERNERVFAELVEGS